MKWSPGVTRSFWPLFLPASSRTISPLAALAHLRQEFAHDAEVHVGLEQRRAHLRERLGDVRVGELGHAAEAVARVLEALAERLEHRAEP